MRPPIPGLALLALAGLVYLPQSFAVASALQLQDPSAPRLEILRRWLYESKLGTLLEPVRVRRMAHPLRPDAAPVPTLELRAKPIGEDADFDVAYLAAFNQRFQREHGTSVWEKLFYKFVHLFELPPDSAVVAVLIYHDELLVFADSTGAVRTRSGALRMVVKEFIVPESTVMSVGASVAPTRERLGKEKATSTDRIEVFLRRRFPSPIALRVVAKTDRYLQVSLSRMRGVVLGGEKAWERLQLTFVLIPDTATTTVVVHADGQFASGAGARPPADEAFQDMEPRYTGPLTEFLGAMSVELKEFLTRSG